MFRKIKTLFHRGWLLQLPSAASSYTLLMNKLQRNEAFAFSRWGDGEWEALLGEKSEDEANCDGHQYFADLTGGLHRILVSGPTYFLGMQKLAYHRLLGRKIDAYLKRHKARLDWLNADAFHDASLHGRIRPFFDILSTKKVLLVGPSHLQSLSIFSFQLSEVPEKNCWLRRHEVLQNIKSVIGSERPDVVLFCAGMTSNWFIHELRNEFSGFLIDVGSLLDPYAGVTSRNYHKKLRL